MVAGGIVLFIGSLLADRRRHGTAGGLGRYRQGLELRPMQPLAKRWQSQAFFSRDLDSSP
jgi:hypothetical protein